MTKEQAIIEKALANVREALLHPNESNQVAPPQQLQRVEHALIEMLDDLRNDLPTSDHSWISRAVTDSWPMPHKLTNQVCGAVHAYRKAIGKRST